MPVKLKTNDGEKESPSCTDLRIPTSPPFTPSFSHPAFSLSAPFVPPLFPAHPKGLLLWLESLILCMCVCLCVFSGWKPCWTHRSGFSGGRLRSQQRLIVRDPIVHGVRGHVCVLCVAVCQCYHFLVFIVSQFFRKRTSCNPLLGRWLG